MTSGLYNKITEKVYEINILSLEGKELEEFSRNRSLGLNQHEMEKIQAHYQELGRNPVDVELEAFAQSWSEHCCYKSSKPILKENVFKTDAPQNICVITEDAGVVEFDEDHAYVMALESHNHPSALDPYGGAATGIGGILRDVACMGAQPIALVDPLFFGPLDYEYEKLPDGVKHPRFLFDGVVSGISAYGNRVGIPTVSGQVEFHEDYVGNCLVNVGCVGIVPKEEIIRSRAGNPGDVFIYAGGKTGRDGIHGVTFASTELDEESEEKDIPAVQLGYAIMKEPLIHACLEANRKKLLTGLKDFGGGGLSCVSSEMAHDAGLGAKIELDKIPLKEEGLSPWEIWVSESQERMMMTVKPENVQEVLSIFEFWDVPAFVVGKVDNSQRVKATYHGTRVLDLDLDFLLQGVVYEREYEIRDRDQSLEEFDMPDLEETIFELISSERIGSRAPVLRRYDHEVRANTAVKPLQGTVNKQTHGDASVIKPLDHSYKGLAICADVNPYHCKLDPYWGAASAVEEVVRNLISVNARPQSLADCLNFGNPEKKHRLGDFVSATDGLYYAASNFDISFTSGNVSFYNENASGSVPPTPSLLGIGLVDDIRKTVTSDFKQEENLIYLIGETKQEMGASEYYRILGKEKGQVPKVHPEKTKKKIQFLQEMMNEEKIKSCHDLSIGGLIASLSEMCFGGDLGCNLDLSSMSLRTDFKLFSESNGRWLVEISKEDEESLLQKAEDLGIEEIFKIGTLVEEKTIRIEDKEAELVLSIEELRRKWEAALEGEK